MSSGMGPSVGADVGAGRSSSVGAGARPTAPSPGSGESGDGRDAAGPPAPSVVTVGLSNLDHVFRVERFPPEASRTPARGYLRQGGGPAATAAVAAARLGARATLCALHGDDAEADALEAELRGHGVLTHGVRRVAGARTWISGVLVTPAGERWIFPYRDPALLGAEPWDAAVLAGAGCVLTDVRHPAQTLPLLVEAGRRGIPTVGDFGDGASWELATHIDHLIVSEECAREVAGTAAPSEALPRLRQREGQVVGVTLGERGYAYLDGDRLEHVPAPAVDAVDTTGAGDVFHGAYAYGVAAGWPVPRCAELATAAAALSCTGVGGRGALPTLAGALDRMPSGRRPQRPPTAPEARRGGPSSVAWYRSLRRRVNRPAHDPGNAVVLGDCDTIVLPAGFGPYVCENLGEGDCEVVKAHLLPGRRDLPEGGDG